MPGSEQIAEEVREANRKLDDAKELEAQNLRAAVAMRNQQAGRVSTIHTVAEQDTGAQGMADLEHGPGGFAGTSATSTNSPPDAQANGGGARRRRRGFLRWFG